MENDVNLNELDPSEILEPSSLETYEEALELIWQQLLRLNSNLFVLDKLLDFPGDLFLGPGKQTFLALAEINLFENSLLTISKLTTDTNKDSLSLPRFKNCVRKKVRQKYLTAFCQLLRDNKFSKTTKTSWEKVKNIRNSFIAHLAVDENLQPKILGHPRVSFQEVKLVTTELNRLFDTLCFGHKRLTLPLDYDPSVQHPPGVDSRPDVEYILDLIAQDSYFFKMPEESQYWDIEKQKLSPEMIGILNKYRRKSGKPEV